VEGGAGEEEGPAYAECSMGVDCEEGLAVLVVVVVVVA